MACRGSHRLTSAVVRRDKPLLNPGRALLYGTLAVGILDGLDAIVFFGLRSGATPVRIFKGIAVGLLGRAALSGGWPTVVLGVLLHFLVAFGVVLVYLLASRRIS